MGDELVFYLILLALFIEESSVNCSVWEIFFRRGVFEGWSFCGNLARKRARGLALLPPMFLAQPFASKDDSISFCEKGASNLRLSAFPLERTLPGKILFFAYEEIAEVFAKDLHVIINGKAFAKCADEESAKQYVALIASLKEAKPENRGALIGEYLSLRFNMEKAKKCLSKIGRKMSAVESVSCFHVLFLFLVFPVLYVLHPSPVFFLVLILAGILLSLACAVFFIVMKAMEGGAWKLFALKNLVFLPFASVIAREIFWKKLNKFHPMLLAVLLLKKEKALEYFSKSRRDLHYPVLRANVSRAALDCANFFNALLMERTDALTASLGAQNLDFPVSSLPDNAVCYCPRCGSHYIVRRETCSDCSCRLISRK